MTTSPAELAQKAKVISRWENEGGAVKREPGAPAEPRSVASETPNATSAGRPVDGPANG